LQGISAQSISHYRKLKRLLKRVPRDTKNKHAGVQNGGDELHSSTHPFQLGDKVEVIPDTTPAGVHSQHSCGIDRAEIIEVGEQCTKVRKVDGLDRNCVTTVPNRL
jgi:hypothetical protein